MQPDHTLATLKIDFFSPDSAVATAAANKLGELGGDEVLDFLISVLKSPNALQRNSAALALRDIGDNRAAEPLWQEILDPQNRNQRATMVYALERLDCSQKLPELFDLLFYGSYEAQMYAGTILDEQIFEFSEADLHTIQSKWDDLQKHPEKCVDFELRKDDIQHFVEGFTSYLNG
jgi:HEAT repeat protein